ncbi:Rad4 beta-hairpin domain 3-domain-containing protein, partial [Mycena belliarum]
QGMGDRGEAMQGLYALSQTEPYVPDPVVNGKILKNRFDNIDMYVPSMLPAGAVHVPCKSIKGTAKIARKLGFDHADAVTGFEFRNRRAAPILKLPSLLLSPRRSRPPRLSAAIVLSPHRPPRRRRPGRPHRRHRPRCLPAAAVLTLAHIIQSRPHILNVIYSLPYPISNVHLSQAMNIFCLRNIKPCSFP